MKPLKEYDLIICGAGPAAFASAIYASRYKLNTLVIGKSIGGQANYAPIIENYPGIANIRGSDLMNNMMKQVESLGCKIIEGEIKEIVKEKDIFVVSTSQNKYYSKTVILAFGTEKSKLGLANEEKFIGKGISYCATCDAPLFKNKIVGVVGGGNSAIMVALLLSEYAKRVHLFYRGSQLRADPSQVERLNEKKNIEIIYNVEVLSFEGKNFLEKIKLSNGKTINLDGLFIEIGAVPPSHLVSKLNIKKDENGYIMTNELMETNIPGCFAAGDIRKKPLRQIVTAVSDGAIASFSAYSYLKHHSS